MLDAWGDHPVVAQTLAEASDALGEDLGRLIHEGPMGGGGGEEAGLVWFMLFRASLTQVTGCGPSPMRRPGNRRYAACFFGSL